MALLIALLFTPKTAYVQNATYMVPMRDGVKLATDVYLFPPDTSVQRPTILIRTPYSKRNEMFTHPIFVWHWIGNGYALVVQDIRGRFASQGIDSLFLDDGWGKRQDGYDTVEWIAQQSWSNGKVGTFGNSATGFTQYLMAGSAPPHLVCQFVEAAGISLYPYPGGVLLKNLVEVWTKLQGNEYLLPFIFAHSSYDEMWERLDLSTRFDSVNVPIYHWGGWYDAQGIEGFAGLQHGGDKGARGKQKLLIGPWTHTNWFNQKQGELTFPPNSTYNDGNEALRWFDYWLKGKNNGIMSEPPVKYYVMGAIESGAPANEWRTASDWPPPSQTTPFYFHANCELTTTPPTATQASLSYQYDPQNPVPNIGGADPYDQRFVENRPDVLIFTTPVLEQPLEVVGKITVKLWVSSSAKDTDFMAKLTDVYPDGRSMLVCDGALRARHRYSLREEHFMTPDSIYECKIDLSSTAIVFNRGHRIRVTISSSNSPRFDPNPNTGSPFRADSLTVVATNTVHLDANYPSHIVLPVTSGTPSFSSLVRVGNSGATPGSTVGVPLELIAQGNENALRFSLNFDPAVLSNPQAKLGRDASAATLTTDSSQAGAGRFGIALAWPAGQTVAACEREIVVVSFTVNANTKANSTRIEFGDQPIVREVMDIGANALSAVWAGGTLNIIHCPLQQLARAEKAQSLDLAVDSKFDHLRQFRDDFLRRYEEGNEYIAMYYAFGEFVKTDPASLLQSVAALPHLYKAIEALQGGNANAVIVTSEMHRSALAIIKNHRNVKNPRLQKMLDRVEKDLNRFQGMSKKELLSHLHPVDKLSDISAEANLPEDFALAQNFPNPFNPETTIEYAIPAKVSGKVRVTLRIYNLLGQPVRTLVDEEKSPGRYHVLWDGKNEAGAQVSSGVYFYTIAAGNFKATKKMAILR
jgi:hypothetical protein